MSVACYTELCEIMMKLTDDRFVESQAFLKLQFTVIGRSNTTASVNWKNTKIEGDHLSTFHSNNKKDQAGTDKSTKACYANPFDPCTCLFTALGIYVLCNPDLHEHFIFVRIYVFHCIMTGLFTYFVTLMDTLYFTFYSRRPSPVKIRQRKSSATLSRHS